MKSIRFFSILSILLCIVLSVRAQVSGVVVDNTGEPLIGVNVMVKGTTIGTITDFDGNFAIDVAPPATIVVSYMGYDTKRFFRKLSKTDEIAVYLAYLLKEIVKENFDVLRFIYRKGQPKPTLVHFHGGVQNDALRVLVANSITLTPGTYTVRLEGDEYAVHALDEYFQVDIEYSAFFKMARKVEEA